MEYCSDKPEAEGIGVDNSVITSSVGSEKALEIPENFKLELFVRKIDPFTQAVYTPEIGQIIAGFTAQNLSLSAISKLPGMPSVMQVKQWIRKNADFAELMKIADEARAEVLADTALSVAGDSVWQTAKSDKIKVETALKLAAAYDPNKFAAKSQVKSEHHETLTFYINTGFDHPGESARLKPIEIETRDPAEVFRETKESDEGNQNGVSSEIGTAGTEEEAEEI